MRKQDRVESSTARLTLWLLRFGLVISAVLLIRFAIDFSEGMKWWLAAPFCLLVMIALGVAVPNVVSVRRESIATYRLLPDPKRAFLLAAVPLGFLASSLDCMGLSIQGCSAFCTFIKLVWIPLIAVCCGVYLLRGKQVWLTAIAAMCFIPLFPHCVCYNVGNAWWIDRIGGSPVCYAWGFVVSIMALGSLLTGERVWMALFACLAIIAGATGFFVAHHYFGFPW